MPRTTRRSEFEFHPLTPERWTDFEVLFGPRGACAGCWCMVWRRSRKEWEAGKGEGNRIAMKTVVDAGREPGIIGYSDGRPAGWCAVAPRAEYPALARSRVLRPLDDTPVWSVTCFFVAKEFRNRGLSVALLRAAIDFVKARGGRVLEGYPVEPRTAVMPAAFAWTGLASAFRKAGFVEAARHAPTRPIMRHVIKF